MGVLNRRPIVIRTILFPTDFTEIATEAGRYAEYLSRMTGARVIVLHTVEPVLLPGTEDDRDLREFSNELERKAHGRIEEAIQVFRAAGIPVEGRVVVGHSFEILESLVQSEGVDLVVMGSHGLVPGQEQALGTLSHKLFFLSKVPVLFLR
jgi:nucleotide-binding universal stress UspA family protein